MGASHYEERMRQPSSFPVSAGLDDAAWDVSTRNSTRITLFTKSIRA
jgi:hypothetical protein